MGVLVFAVRADRAGIVSSSTQLADILEYHVHAVGIPRAKLAARERRYFEDLRTTQIVVVTITSNMFWGQTHKKTQYI